MENTRYYIQSQDDIWKTFNNYYQLLCFIDQHGRYRFGNSHQDKRWTYKKIESIWFRFRILQKRDPEQPEEPFVSEFLPVEWIVWDSQYNRLDIKQLDIDSYKKEEFKPDYCYRYRRTYKKSDGYLGFRNGPVPYTGVNHGYNYYRNIKTTQERRLNYAYEGYTRGKRRNLPCSWDDINRSDVGIKQSWKKNKKRKQWM